MNSLASNLVLRGFKDKELNCLYVLFVLCALTEWLP